MGKKGENHESMSVYPRVIIKFHDVHVFLRIFSGEISRLILDGYKPILTSLLVWKWEYLRSPAKNLSLFLQGPCGWLAMIWTKPMGIEGLKQQIQICGWDSNGKIHYKWAIFHSYVKLPESNANMWEYGSHRSGHVFFVQRRLQGVVKPATMGM